MMHVSGRPNDNVDQPRSSCHVHLAHRIITSPRVRACVVRPLDPDIITHHLVHSRAHALTRSKAAAKLRNQSTYSKTQETDDALAQIFK